MFGLGMGELLIILVIVIIVFGSTRLPMIGQGLGRGIQNFKKEVKDLKKKKAKDSPEEEAEIKDVESEVIEEEAKK